MADYKLEVQKMPQAVVKAIQAILVLRKELGT